MLYTLPASSQRVLWHWVDKQASVSYLSLSFNAQFNPTIHLPSLTEKLKRSFGFIPFKKKSDYKEADFMAPV